MKKSMVILVLLAACIPVPLQAQDGSTSPWFAGFDIRGSLPTGDFKDYASFGFGGTGFAGYSFSPIIAVTGRAGYIFTGGKDNEITYSGFTGNVKTNYGIVPLLGGIKVFFNEGDTRFYVSGEAGLFILSGTTETTNSSGGAVTSSSSSDQKFGYVPAAGAQFRSGYNMMVDARVDYTGIPDNTTKDGKTFDISFITFAVGFEWTLN